MEQKHIINKKTMYDLEVQDLLIHTNMPFCSRIGMLISEKDLKVERYRIVAIAMIDLENNYNKIFNELLEYKQRFGDIS